MTNKEIATRFLERTINERDAEGASADMLAAGFVFHNGRDRVTAASGWVAFAEGWLAGFPDLTIEVTFLMAEGDRVLARWQGTGTHRGSFRGVAATGRRIEASGMTLFQIHDGLIVEMWDSPSALGQPDSMRVLDWGCRESRNSRAQLGSMHGTPTGPAGSSFEGSWIACSSGRRTSSLHTQRPIFRMQ